MVRNLLLIFGLRIRGTMQFTWPDQFLLSLFARSTLVRKTLIVVHSDGVGEDFHMSDAVAVDRMCSKALMSRLQRVSYDVRRQFPVCTISKFVEAGQILGQGIHFCMSIARLG